MLKDFFEGSRKFTVMAAVLLIGVVFRIANLINGSDLVSLFNGVGIAFMGSNAIERVSNAAIEWAKSTVAKDVEDK